MKPHARRQQRVVLVGLIGLVFTAVLRPLLLPRQPPLPQLETRLSIDDGAWRLDADQPVTPSRRLHQPWRSLAMGPTRRLVHASGQELLLTPLASWDAKALTEACVSGDRNSQRQPGTGDREMPASAHTCLTRHQKVAHREEELAGLLWERDPKFFKQPLRNLRALLLPIRPRYSTAVLLSAEGEIGDQTIWESSAFVKGVSEAVLWPAEPKE